MTHQQLADKELQWTPTEPVWMKEEKTTTQYTHRYEEEDKEYEETDSQVTAEEDEDFNKGESVDEVQMKNEEDVLERAQKKGLIRQ